MEVPLYILQSDVFSLLHQISFEVPIYLSLFHLNSQPLFNFFFLVLLAENYQYTHGLSRAVVFI